MLQSLAAIAQVHDGLALSNSPGFLQDRRQRFGRTLSSWRSSEASWRLISAGCSCPDPTGSSPLPRERDVLRAPVLSAAGRRACACRELFLSQCLYHSKFPVFLGSRSPSPAPLDSSISLPSPPPSSLCLSSPCLHLHGFIISVRVPNTE